MRNRHAVGDHLAQCDLMGTVHYGSEMVLQWDGQLVHRENYEPRNPQDFVRAKNDPYPVPNARPVTYDRTLANSGNPTTFVGLTTVRTKTGPASHLFS